MSEKYPYYNAQVIVTKNPDKFLKYFHKNTIYSKLDDEYVLRLLFLQKFKICSSNPTNLTIYLDQLQLEDFNLNPKLLFILKNKSDSLNIYIKNSDNINQKQALLYKNFINRYKTAN